MISIHVGAGDWREVGRIIAASKAKTLKEKAAVILSLFPWFRKEQVAGTDEWMLVVQAQSGKERSKKDRRSLTAHSGQEEQTGPQEAQEASLEEQAERIAREHPEWPRREIAGTQEWKDYVRSQAASGWGDHPS
jgi:hypothetical protein